MSIVRCEFCQKNIDTDFDAEHFVDEDMEYCIVEEEYREGIRAKDKLHNAAPDLLEVALGWRTAFNERVLMKVENEEDKKFLLELNKKTVQTINKATS